VPAGRPTKYSDVYCDEVIETMGTGLSLTAFAGVIGVARSTINVWMGEHPEFSEAVKIGTAKRVHYLERRLLDGEIGPRVTSHIFALKNADPEEWRDKVENHHTGNIEHTVTRIELVGVSGQ
jgi:hypothetical protein